MPLAGAVPWLPTAVEHVRGVFCVQRSERGAPPRDPGPSVAARPHSPLFHSCLAVGWAFGRAVARAGHTGVPQTDILVLLSRKGGISH